MYWLGTKDIKYYIEKLLNNKKLLLEGKVVLDFPAGNGVTSAQLHIIGAKVIAMDLFPEFFRAPGIECIKADLGKEIKLSNGTVDWVICQEGIEHLPNQIYLFSELNRVLKNNGRLIITTPNYSNLRAKVSHFLTESELYNKLMPPNEYDSVWHSRDNNEVYWGHINLIGITKLRLFALMNGFKIVSIHSTRVNYTALLIFLFTYPFILLSSFLTYRRFCRKNKGKDLKDLFKLMISPKILLCGHLIVEFEKQGEVQIFGNRADCSNYVT